MMLLFGAFVASLDGLLIGIGLKLMNRKMSIRNIGTLFLDNFIIYSILLSLYYLFEFQFVTKFISTLLYFLLAILSLRSQEESVSIPKGLSFIHCIALTLTHSIDGVCVSVGFVYHYPLWIIISLFSFMSVFLMVLGYLLGGRVPQVKKSNYVSALLFFLLALFNQFL